MIEEESLGFHRNFWGPRPALQEIFESREFDDYQGRELSYGIDYLDAQWTRALLDRGVVLFIAPSVLLASLAFVPIGLWLVPRALPNLDPDVGWLALLLYLSSFAVASTTGLLYRATKPLVAPLLLVLLLVLLAEWRRPRLRPAAAFGACFGAALLASLLDRQGLFYVLVALAALGLAWIRTRRGLALGLGIAAAVLVWFVYTYRIGPWLIYALNGYWPDMSFQQLRAEWLLAADPWIEALRLLGDWTSVLIGGLPAAVLLPAAGTAAGLAAWGARARPGRIAWAAAAVLAALAAQILMLAMMVVRHQPVTWVDHRFWYYPLPYHALLVFGLLWWHERHAAGRRRSDRVVRVALAALVLSNLVQWPARRQVMEQGPWFSGVARRSALLARSLRSGRPEPLLDGEYRRFYYECLELFPRHAAGGAYVADGAGVPLSEIQDGRVVAPVRREARLAAHVTAPGRYRLAGSAFLRPDQRLSLWAGSRLLGETDGREAATRPTAFAVAADLAGGRTELLLRVRLDAPRDGGDRRFLLVLPVEIERTGDREP